MLFCATAAHAQEGPAPLARVAAPENKAVYSLFNPTPQALLRELSTDRPDKTESPYTVDAGHVQIELDFATFTRDRDRSGGSDRRVDTFNIMPLNLKLGLTNHTDVQVGFDAYIQQRVNDKRAGARQRIDGIGDVTIRLKHNFFGNDGGDAALALMPFITLPTNSNGLGVKAVEGGLIAPLAVALPGQFNLGLMIEGDVVRNAADTGYAASLVNSATISRDLTDRLGLYVELFIEQTMEGGAQFVATLDSGLTYAIGRDMQLDLGVNTGVTKAADDVNAFLGLSRRF